MPTMIRKATEEETRKFIKERKAAREDARRLRGKEAIQACLEFSRSTPFMYCVDLNCVLRRPTKDEVFESWCDDNNIERAIRDTVRIGWDGAFSLRDQSMMPPELEDEIKKARSNQPNEPGWRDRRAKEFTEKYSV